MQTEKEPVYRVLFMQDDKLYEVYARYISEESLMGFLEIEELLFQESENAAEVDPSEERLLVEFKGVQRSYIPMHLILRVDEVVKRGVPKSYQTKGNVHHLSAVKMKQKIEREKE